MISIRNYSLSDYPEVKIIIEEAEVFDKVWDSEENLSSMIKKDPKGVLVAQKDKQIAGIIMLVPFGSEAFFFYRLAVLKKYRNQGIGSQLLEKAEQIAKEKGVKEIAFYVNTDKPELRKYYEKKGYQTSEKTYLTMWKQLK